MNARTLTLRKDTLTELTNDELARVAGGSADISGLPCQTTESLGLSCGCTGYYPSIFDPCTGQ